MRDKLPTFALFFGFILLSGYLRYQRVSEQIAPQIAHADAIQKQMDAAIKEAEAQEKELAELQQQVLVVIKDALVDQWADTADPNHTMRFTRDGEFTTKVPGLLNTNFIRGKYRLIDAQTIEFSSEGVGAMKWDCKLEGDSLDLRSPNGPWEHFIRSK